MNNRRPLKSICYVCFVAFGLNPNCLPICHCLRKIAQKILLTPWLTYACAHYLYTYILSQYNVFKGKVGGGNLLPIRVLFYIKCIYVAY